MRKSLFSLIAGLLLIFLTLQAKGINVDVPVKSCNVSVSFKTGNAVVTSAATGNNDSIAKDSVRPKKHRLVAALLAFPLGILGLHRMYLGTSPIVPIIYIVTIGGVFGVLPFIDFVLILLSKDIHKTYINNHHLFMWQKNSDKK